MHLYTYMSNYKLDSKFCFTYLKCIKWIDMCILKIYEEINLNNVKK